jgi:hypothetical protein
MGGNNIRRDIVLEGHDIEVRQGMVGTHRNHRIDPQKPSVSKAECERGMMLIPRSKLSCPTRVSIYRRTLARTVCRPLRIHSSGFYA